VIWDPTTGAARWRFDPVLILSSPVFNSSRKLIADLSTQARLPAIMPFPGFAEEGGLLGYGPQLLGMFRQSGAVMVKVLKGTPPGDIPVERPTRFQLIVNQKTAKTLGLTIPQSILIRADHVIQ
jgi:putative ABC transport system substrate-binding protein